MEDFKLPELTEGVLAKLEELNYSKVTLNGHRCVYRMPAGWRENDAKRVCTLAEIRKPLYHGV